jgi:Copper amine oxidase N-terminal domain
MKKVRTGMMTIAALAVLGTNLVSAAPAPQNKELSVQVNGKKTENMAIMDQGQQTVLVPLRDVAESLGFQVTWNTAAQAAEVRKGEITGQVKLNEVRNPLDKQDKMFRPQPRLVNGNTYVPVGFVAEVLQAEVNVTDDAVTVSEEPEVAPVKKGTITSINKNDKGQFSIHLDGYNTGLILHLSEETNITSADGKELKPEDLKMGMEVEATHPNYMAMSMPPQASAISIVVKSSLETADVLGTAGQVASVEKTQDGAYRILVEGNAITEQSQEKVSLLITEDTVIVNARDQQRMKPEDLKPEMKVWAYYGPKLTRSLPPQGVAEKIVVEIVEENK